MHRLKNDQQDENILRRISIGAHFRIVRGIQEEEGRRRRLVSVLPEMKVHGNRSATTKLVYDVVSF
jgi:hypothetical protein